MDEEIFELKEKWRAMWPAVSGKDVIDTFGNAAWNGWPGAEALIDTYNELQDKTGEGPSQSYISDALYLKIKGYWSDELSIEQLRKLDDFLANVSNT